MKILLSGGGEPEQVQELDKYFAHYVGGEKILYIPVAMDKIPYDSCEQWFRETYRKYNITNIDICCNLNDIKSLNGYKAVFIGGGNTFKLLKEIKESNFEYLIKNYLKHGGFVYGGSAGAIIFGKTIETSSHADKNLVKLTDLNGLNMLNGYDVWCHYNEKKDSSEILKLKNKTMVLYEESGIIYDGKNFISIGRQSLIFPDDFTENK